jgi:hypothetical protein
MTLLPDTGGGPGPGDEVHIARLRHPRRIAAFVVVVVLLMVGAFITGRYVTSPTDAALRGASVTVPVTTAVEERVVSPGYALPAALTEGTAFDVTIEEAPVESSATASPAEGAAGPSATEPATGSANTADPSTAESASQRVVVTSTSVAVGDTVGPGRLLAEVSGRPVFSIPTSVPLYRDLLPGMSGNDVRAVQQTLIDLDYRGVALTAILDTGTVDALARLYRAAGYRLPYVAPGVRGLAIHEFAGVPTNDATVLSVAGLGTALSGDVALVRLQTSPPVLTAQITAAEHDVVTVGATVTVSTADSGPLSTTVLTVGAFSAGDGSSASGYPVTLAVPEGLGADPGSAIQVTPAGESTAGPAVPLVALRQEGTRTYVILADEDAPAQTDAASEDTVPAGVSQPSGTPAPPVEVDVDVLAQADGWAAITATDQLPPGRRLQVEP